MENLLIFLVFLVVLVLLSRVRSLSRRVEHLHSYLLDIKTVLDEVRKDQIVAKQDCKAQVKVDKEPIPSVANTDTYRVDEKIIEEIIPQEEPIFLDTVEDILNTLEEEQKTIEFEPKMLDPIVEYEGMGELETRELTASTAFTTTPTAFEPKKESKIKDKTLFQSIFIDNWLSKIGIVTLVLGIAFFVKYAIDQEWINEVGRVGIGILTGGIILGIAHKLRTKYQVFSSILAGGGISVLYITITLAFREYELFNQTVAFVMLVVITLFSVALSLLYDRRELAIFSLLGGFASPLLISTGSGNYVVLFSYLLILNSGMLILSMLKRWRELSIISFLLSIIFFCAWMFKSFEEQYTGATLFASLFFVQFYLFAIIDHFKSDRKLSVYQILMILINNMFLFTVCMYIFSDFKYDVRGIITIVIALVNAVVMIALFRKSKVDNNMIYLIVAVVMTLVSLAVPIQLRGYVITMFWAAEAVLLLWLWQRARIKILSIGFLAVTCCMLISYCMDIGYNYSFYLDTPLTIVLNRIFITGLVVIASTVVNLVLLNKESQDSVINIGKLFEIRISRIGGVFKILLLILSFIVPYLELNYQLTLHTDINYVSSFRKLTLATYTLVYIAIVAYFYRDKVISSKKIAGLLYLTVFLHIILSSLVTDLRWDIYVGNNYSPMYFLVHLFSLPAISYIVYLLVVSLKSIDRKWYKVAAWFLLIATIILLSVELDNLTIMFFGSADHYFYLLDNIQTFGYPILWGLVAMLLMIWGLKKDVVLLRRMSLISFGFIVVKFYAYDVWHMSQGGRIVSFVVLGIILLVVSFLQQKIKTLIQDDKIEDELNKEKQDEIE